MDNIDEIGQLFISSSGHTVHVLPNQHKGATL